VIAMRFILNIPNGTNEEIDHLSKIFDTLSNAQKELLADPNIGWLMLNLSKFEIVDLQKGIIYSYDGHSIDLKAYTA
jgi:hypothetical protein